MSSYRTSTGILALLSCVAILQNAWYWSQLPERVATHFDGAGQPDRWMSRPYAVGIMLAFQVGVPFFILATVRLSAYCPESMCQMPHHQFWLAPERRAATVSHVAGTMGWLAVLVSCFMMAINHLTFVANRDGTRLNTVGFIVALIGFLVSFFGLIGRIILHFRRGEPVS